MLLTEYDPEKEKELLAKMAYKEGQMSMRIRNLTTLMRVESLSLEQAMDKLEVRLFRRSSRAKEGNPRIRRQIGPGPEC